MSHKHHINSDSPYLSTRLAPWSMVTNSSSFTFFYFFAFSRSALGAK